MAFRCRTKILLASQGKLELVKWSISVTRTCNSLSILWETKKARKSFLYRQLVRKEKFKKNLICSMAQLFFFFVVVKQGDTVVWAPAGLLFCLRPSMWSNLARHSPESSLSASKASGKTSLLSVAFEPEHKSGNSASPCIWFQGHNEHRSAQRHLHQRHRLLGHEQPLSRELLPHHVPPQLEQCLRWLFTPKLPPWGASSSPL